MRMFFYFSYVIFLILVFLPLFITGWLLGKTVDRKWRVTHFMATLYSRMLIATNPKWSIEMEGLENIEKGKEYLLMANHSSLYDIPLVNILPINMRWVAKYELYRVPIMGQILYFKNDIMVKRGDPESAKMMMINSLSCLKRGITISVFPEGTRSKTGKVAPFKEGAFLIAKKARVAVLPVVLQGPFEVNNMPMMGQFSKYTFRLRVLPPITVEEVKSMGVKELCDHTHDLILKNHMEMAPHIYKD